MNILILASTYPRRTDDTVPRFVHDFAVSLVPEHTVTVLAPYEKGAKLREVIDGVAVYRFPYAIPGLERLAYRGGMVNAFRDSWLAKLQLPFFLCAELAWTVWLSWRRRIKLVNAHWLVPQGLVAWLANFMTGKPYIITTHGGDVAILRHRRIARLAAPALCAAKNVTFVSPIAREQALQSITITSAEKLAILPMGIHLPQITRQSGHRHIEIVFIGRLVKIKGVEFLLDAFARLYRNQKQLLLRILGDGPDKAALQQQANDLNLGAVVSFEGYVGGERKAALLSAADIIVVPSIRDEHGYEEGLPVSALEAFAYKKALVATSTGSLPALVDGSNGLLVPGADSQALAAALAQVVADGRLRRNIAEAGFKTVQDYTWPSVARRFSALAEAATRA